MGVAVCLDTYQSGPHVTITGVATRLLLLPLTPFPRLPAPQQYPTESVVTPQVLEEPALAQDAWVSGVVVGEDGRTPLPGVHVSLLREGTSEQHIAAVLTDSRGLFFLAAPASGQYWVKAQRVGLANAETPSFPITAAGREIIVIVSEQAVELRGLVVESPVRSCDLDVADALVVQAWWEESRKALENADYVQSQGGRGYRYERFRKEWSADLRTVRWEEYTPPDSTAQLPFRAPDASVLAERGFVQGPPGDRRFFGPDPAVLVSEAFLDGHCFRPEPSDEPGVLRLRVEPVEDTEHADIAGVLSVDTISGYLLSFEFRYVGLPDDLRIAREAGGRLEFEYLPSGDWIVSEWWIRMPLIDSRVWPRRVLAYVDDGGRVVDVPSQPETIPIAVRDLSPTASQPTIAVGPGRREPIVPMFNLEPIEVSVDNDRIIDVLNMSLGVDPRSLFGFRLLQGAQLEQAKLNGSMSPTETLGWLFVPVVHGARCVYVNVNALGDQASANDLVDPDMEPFCGNLFVDEEWVPNEQIESIDMSDVVVVTILPGDVRFFTRSFLQRR